LEFLRHFGRIFWVALASLAATSSATAQIVSPPKILHFCSVHCSTWYLTNDGFGYAAVAGYPSIPNNSPGVVIARFTRDAVVLNRTDAPNRSFPKGLRAIITGQIAPTGDRLVHGRQTWTFGPFGVNVVEITWGQALNAIPGAGDPALSIFAQDLDPPARDDQYPPPVLHFCAAHCATWYLTTDKKGYTGVVGYPDIPEGLGVSIGSFTRGSVVLNRNDPPNPSFPNGLTAVISGTVSPQGNTLENGTIRWTAGQAGTFAAQISWGTALNALPGQDPPAQSWEQKLNGSQVLQNAVLLMLMMPERRCKTEYYAGHETRKVCEDD